MICLSIQQKDVQHKYYFLVILHKSYRHETVTSEQAILTSLINSNMEPDSHVLEVWKRYFGTLIGH